jgi:lipid-binding SYLF domain-containing protein
MRSLLAVFLVLCSGALLAAQDKEAERLQKAATVVEEVMGTPEQSIPQELLNKAVCVGVIPSYKKGALGIGFSGGKGALVCRRGGNGPWGGPSMFTLGGVSIGLQLGGQATDIVFIVMNPKGAEKLLQSRSKLGAEASVAGGPVGRTAQGATDIQLHAEILSYSRSRGLFAGLSLEGAVLKQSHGANEKLYGRKVDPKDILFTGSVGVPAGGRPLTGALQKLSPRGGQPFKEK